MCLRALIGSLAHRRLKRRLKVGSSWFEQSLPTSRAAQFTGCWITREGHQSSQLTLGQKATKKKIITQNEDYFPFPPKCFDNSKNINHAFGQCFAHTARLRMTILQLSGMPSIKPFLYYVDKNA